MKAAALLLLLGAALARAQAPPVDPWADAAWQDVLYGLAPGKLARVHATQQLFDAQAGAPSVLSARDVQLEFADGRLVRLTVDETRRGESSRRRSYHYVYDAGRLLRIDEDGQTTPALARRYDAAGRPIEQAERDGALVVRTTWRYDAAGRPIERAVDSGGSRMQETRRYRRDGTLERLQVESGALVGRRVEFDGQERPVRIRVTDAFDRHDTTIAYPSPTEAVHATSGFAFARDGAGRYAHTTHYRVRTPQELRGVEAPALPTLRRHVRGGLHDETQTEFDPSGRVLVERRYGVTGNITCTSRLSYHPSGPPLAARSERARPDARCEGSDFDNEVEADAQGHWVGQRMWLLRPDGQRRLVSVQTRRVELAP